MAQVDFVNVGKTFDAGIVAVEDFSLTVEEGEFLILVGPSGCGKTTLLRMVAGLEEVTSGEILIAGSPSTISRRPSATLRWSFRTTRSIPT